MHRGRGRSVERQNRFEGMGVEVFTPLPSLTSLARVRQEKKGEKLNFGGGQSGSSIREAREAHIRNKTPEPLPLPPPLGKDKNSPTKRGRKQVEPSADEESIQNKKRKTPAQPEESNDELEGFVRRRTARTPPPTNARRLPLSNIPDICGARGRTPEPPASHMKPAVTNSDSFTRRSADRVIIPNNRTRRSVAPTSPPMVIISPRRNVASSSIAQPTLVNQVLHTEVEPPKTRGRPALRGRRSAEPSVITTRTRRSVEPITLDENKVPPPRGRNVRKSAERYSPLAPPMNDRRSKTRSIERSIGTSRETRNTRQKIPRDAETRDIEYDRSDPNDAGRFPSVTTMIEKLYVPQWENGEVRVPNIFNATICEAGFSNFVAQIIMDELNDNDDVD